ncbi:MAG TPA: hypothetical protein VIA06_11415 [Candidatus Dormibacteraeota bacterium]|nr:hypothetical protein [Candidatus Dormibacteraeota bacterium]
MDDDDVLVGRDGPPERHLDRRPGAAEGAGERAKAFTHETPR